MKSSPCFCTVTSQFHTMSDFDHDASSFHKKLRFEHGNAHPNLTFSRTGLPYDIHHQTGSGDRVNVSDAVTYLVRPYTLEGTSQTNQVCKWTHTLRQGTLVFVRSANRRNQVDGASTTSKYRNHSDETDMLSLVQLNYQLHVMVVDELNAFVQGFGQEYPEQHLFYDKMLTVFQNAITWASDWTPAGVLVTQPDAMFQEHKVQLRREMVVEHRGCMFIDNLWDRHIKPFNHCYIRLVGKYMKPFTSITYGIDESGLGVIPRLQYAYHYPQFDAIQTDFDHRLDCIEGLSYPVYDEYSNVEPKYYDTAMLYFIGTCYDNPNNHTKSLATRTQAYSPFEHTNQKEIMSKGQFYIQLHH